MTIIERVFYGTVTITMRNVNKPRVDDACIRNDNAFFLKKSLRVYKYYILIVHGIIK